MWSLTVALGNNYFGKSSLFFVYQRADGYVHILNSGSEVTARTSLNVLPEPYEILHTAASLVEAKEWILNEHGTDDLQ